jgi:putative ABC transport system permease protein
MILLENFRIALRALTANKLRSALTMLGIVIGVGAVVALLAIGQGATSSITSQVEGMGSNLVTVMAARGFGGPRENGSPGRLYYSDYLALSAAVGKMATLSPVFQTSETVKNGNRNAQYSITGVTPDFAYVRDYSVEKGRFITDNDQGAGARVAVLGSQAASELFGNLDPIGRQLKIGELNFTIVGVLQAKGSTGFGSSDDVILIPLETGYSRLFGARALDNGARMVSSISMAAATPEDVNPLITRTDYILRKQHKLSSTDEADFSLLSQNQIISTLSTITTTLTVFLGAIAAISLLVGGIGIMNIMLVSVTERTREIGLRKAVGAQRSHILIQFLIETVTLSLLGGIIGIGLGVGVATIFTKTGLITAQVSANSILLAFTFALAVGVFFGLYPASRAAGLSPMEALRYE